uniref:Uncharacterized protein n=1 Tax=Aegilops tauschii subsp. strangulata TaxID=200361 RepID=A0A453TE97_AEGTS
RSRWKRTLAILGDLHPAAWLHLTVCMKAVVEPKAEMMPQHEFEVRSTKFLAFF